MDTTNLFKSTKEPYQPESEKWLELISKLHDAGVTTSNQIKVLLALCEGQLTTSRLIDKIGSDVRQTVHATVCKLLDAGLIRNTQEYPGCKRIGFEWALTNRAGEILSRQMPVITVYGHPAMRDWNPGVRMGHAPQWVKMAVRKHALSKGTWRSGDGFRSHLERDFLDHWGSIPGDSPDAPRKLFTQPYWDCTNEALKFAHDVGCEVHISKPGPWHRNTNLVVFTQR